MLVTTSHHGSPGLTPGQCHVGFVVDDVAKGWGYSYYFGFPCQFSFHQLLPHWLIIWYYSLDTDSVIK
jgi:hypothetical protein